MADLQALEGLQKPDPLGRGLRTTQRTSLHLPVSLIGKSAYLLYHRPLGQICQCLRAGGPLEQWKTERGRGEMEKAASGLQPLGSPDASSPAFHFLTGKRFWYQTASTVVSFQRVTGLTPKVWLYDDGTMTDKALDCLEQLITELEFQSQEVTENLLNQHLPETRFPYLRERWKNYPNIRKLTDVHLGGAGWKLVLDSDLLFFRKPDEIIRWVNNPPGPLHATDVEESYGYPRTLMENLCGASIPHRLNVGVCGLKSDDIDWEKLEAWTRALIEAQGPHYYLEQALVAMLVAGRDGGMLPAEDYVTRPDETEARTPTAVMHHYVADSKKWYFRENWRRFIDEC